MEPLKEVDCIGAYTAIQKQVDHNRATIEQGEVEEHQNSHNIVFGLLERLYQGLESQDKKEYKHHNSIKPIKSRTYDKSKQEDNAINEEQSRHKPVLIFEASLEGVKQWFELLSKHCVRIAIFCGAKAAINEVLQFQDERVAEENDWEWNNNNGKNKQ